MDQEDYKRIDSAKASLQEELIVLPCVKAFPLRTTSYDSGREVATHPVLTSLHLPPPHHPRFQSGCVADLPD
jgi:hypothetical protein